MTQPIFAPGRPVRLELNAQRVAQASEFYRMLFGWTVTPLHVPPWGSIPMLANGSRTFGNEFMAMGAFATPQWLTWFTGDLEHAQEATIRLGGSVGDGIYTLGDLGNLLDATDPDGHRFALIQPSTAPPSIDAGGDPCLAEFWGPGASQKAAFYAEVFQLTAATIPSGAMLSEEGQARLFFRDTDYEIQSPAWIPYFRSNGVGGDCERARRAGAVVQVHKETIAQLGEVVVLADPAGAYFGLVDPSAA